MWIPSPGASVPGELGCATLLAPDAVTNPELIKSCSRVCIKLNPQPPPSLSWRSVSAQGWKFQPSYLSVFLVTSRIPRLAGGLPVSHFRTTNAGVLRRGSSRITKDSPITQETPRVLGALCQEPETKTRYIIPQLFWGKQTRGDSIRGSKNST